MRSFTRGELRATRTATLTAPNLFGTVQVTRLAPLGSFAREKDLIVEFDDSEVQSRLEQTQLQMEQLDEQIKKAQADLNIRNNQDQVDLLRANYAVRRAELEVKRNELLATIDQKKNLLNLEEAKRRLDQLKSDIKSKQEQAVAEIAVLRERRNRSMLDINREKMRLAQVKLLAPISGLVAIRQNRSGFSGMFGTTVPDIREGDQVPPGSPVTDVLDLSELEVIARVGEIDRANLKEGQEVLIRLDALPEKTFDGKIKSMSGTASANLFSSDPGKKFDVVFSIDMRQLLTSLGAKPDQIARILATAEINRKKPIAQPMTSMLGMGGFPGAGGMAGGGMPGGAMAGGTMPGGAMPGGAMPGGAMPGGPMQGGQGGAMPGGMQGGAGGAQGGGGRDFGGGGFGGGNMTPEQQQKMREAFQKATGGKNIQDMTPEERQAVFAKMRETMQAAQKADDEEGRRKEGRRKEGGRPASGGRRPHGAPRRQGHRIWRPGRARTGWTRNDAFAEPWSVHSGGIGQSPVAPSPGRGRSIGSAAQAGAAGGRGDHRREGPQRRVSAEPEHLRQERQADGLREVRQQVGTARSETVEAQRVGEHHRIRRKAGRHRRSFGSHRDVQRQEEGGQEGLRRQRRRGRGTAWRSREGGPVDSHERTSSVLHP